MTITIITINYNNCQGLSRTIESVVSQTSLDYEWIVIDGGSTDGSVEVLERNKDCFAFCVSEKDSGVYNAMNKGILHATGDYIIFMNSGDVFLNAGVLQDVIPLLDKDIVAGAVLIEGTEKRKTSPSSLTPWSVLNYNIPHQAEFIRRSLFSTIGLYAEDLSILSDLEFNLKASLKDCSYKSLQYDVASVEQGGISCTQIEKVKQENRRIQDRNLPLAVCKDYDRWKKMRNNPSYPAISWAIRRQWPLRFLNLLYRLFGKKK